MEKILWEKIEEVGGGSSPNQSENTTKVNIPQKIYDDLVHNYKEEDALDFYEWDISEAEEYEGYEKGSIDAEEFEDFSYGRIDRDDLRQLYSKVYQERKKLFDEIEKITGLKVYDRNWVSSATFSTSRTNVFYDPSRPPHDLSKFTSETAIIPKIIGDGNSVDGIEGLDLTPKTVWVKKGGESIMFD